MDLLPVPDLLRGRKESASDLAFLSGVGEMSERMRAFDWTVTPIGPPERWSPALRSAVSLMLANRFPLLLWWGRQYVSIYNDAYVPILGTKHPKALGQPVHDCWHEIWHILQPLIDAPFHGGAPTWIEDLMLEVNRHGYLEEGHWTVAYSPVRDETVPSGIGGVLATVHEITEKVVGERRVTVLRDLAARATESKTAEDACSVAAETLARHAKDIPFALLYVIDADGKRARLAGRAGVTETAAKPPVIELATDVSDQQPWPLAKALGTESLYVLEGLRDHWNEVPRGPWFDAPRQAVIVAIRSNVAHRTAGVLIAGVSSRLRLDERYKDFYELVAGQIATAIANARAHEEEHKRAEALAELDRAKTTFFSNVSHEFRTPLTLMLGPVEELLVKSHADLSPAVKGQLEVVNRNGLRLLRLVNNLLDFSRIEAGRVQAVYEPTDLASFTAELASCFRSATERAGIKLVVDCRPLSDCVYVDRHMWEKIVLNLLSNSFKFTFDGEIEVSLKEVGNPTPHVELRVRDTGVGIPADHIPHLFERFYRVDNMRSRTHEGTGIGLALVQELVKLQSGSVRVESEIDRGSVFFVTVPLGTEHLPAAQIDARRGQVSTAMGAGPFVAEALRWLPDAPEESEVALELPAPHEIIAVSSPRGSENQETDRPLIVVADDNADMRHYIVRLLAERYRLEAVGDGEAALETVRKHQPDLVLSDVMMPRLDGFGLLRELRANATTKTIPVILLSARAGEDSRVEGLQHGADDYLIKPFSARELLARVAAHLDLARLRREAGEALRESEVRFRNMADNSPMMVWITDAKARCTYLNQRWYDFIGQTPETGLEFGRLEGVHPDDRESAEEAFRSANERHAPYRWEYRLRRRDGEYRWVIDAAAPRYSENREFLGYIGSVFDITERKKAEADIAFLGSIVQNSDDAIISKGLDGVITSWNAGAKRLFGYSDAEAIGQPITMLIPPDRLDEEPKIIDALKRGERVDHFETRRRCKDGTLLDISLTISPVKDSQGRIIGASKIARDITERKRAEEALRRMNDELEERVAKRTYELAQSEDRLRTLTTELNLIEQRERKRLAIELHDHLQQMLVLGKLTVGQGKRLAAGVPAYEQVLKKMDDILSDALRYTRSLVSDLSPTVLRDHGLAAALQWLGTYMEKYDQTVTVTVQGEEDLKLPDDKVILLFQSVRELLINSSKHAGTNKATVRMEQCDGLLQIDVRDEGAGFDVAARTPSGGLSFKFGLSSIRERMRALGGSFQIESAPGKGTIATLVLPLAAKPVVGGQLGVSRE